MNRSTFTVTSSSSLVVWFDIYVPKDAPAGVYTGSINVYEGTQVSTTIPISLNVYPFTMPDSPSASPMGYQTAPFINQRHGGVAYPTYTSLTSSTTITRLHWYQALRRFNVYPAGDQAQGGCGNLIQNGPCPEYQIQLDGTLFDPTSGYANAPGIRTPVPVYMMFGYGSWRGTSFWPYTYAATCSNANIWVQWFENNAPKAEYFWYMEDEPTDITQTSAIWSTWVSTCAAPGNRLAPWVTISPERVDTQYPNIIHVGTTREVWTPSVMETAIKDFQSSNKRRITYYNGFRPFTGSTATDDDGVAPRVWEWVQFKKKFDHYFIWETTNYSHGANVDNNLWHDALTFGYYTSDSGTYGRTGFNYSNGDGVMFYPGTDTLFPADSYGADIPFPSWRLMMWRRGINDFDYLKMAYQYDPKSVNAIVQRIIPQVLWERGVVDPNDPTYDYGPKTWSSDPNVWEIARKQLADIISRHR